MYFWNIKKLKAHLIERPMTDKEALPYFIVFLMLLVLGQYAHKTPVYEVWEYIEISIGVLSTLFGTYWLYLRNKGALGNQFLQRYISLNWVVLIRFVVFAIPTLILVGIVSAIINHGTPPKPGKDWHNIAAILIFVLTYYWYFGKHLADVAKNAKY